MKSRKVTALAAAAVLALSGSFLPARAEEPADDGQIYLGYCQAEKYYEFDYQLYYITDALVQSGALEGVDMEGLTEESSAREIWDRVCSTQDDSSAVLFAKDGYMDYSDPEYADLDDAGTAKAVDSFFERSHAELILSMGTSGGLMVKDSTDLPYMNFVASDPVASGIVESQDSSGDDRAWALVSVGSDRMSLGVMNDIFAPKKLGIVYADNEDAYIYSGAENVDAFALENGMTVEKRFVEDEFPEEEYSLYVKNMRKAHEELAEAGIDVYILTTSVLEDADLKYVLEPFMEKGIPSYSINSTQDVHNGAMAAVALLDYRNIGKFAAENFQSLLDGESLGSLPQVYNTAPYLVFNYDTVRRTGYQLPFQILVSADEIWCEE